MIRFFDQSRLLYSRLIKALRLALCLALHYITGFVSMQLIEAFDAVLIVQLVHRRILRAV